MRKVYLYSYMPKLHSLYTEMISSPPEGYEFVVNEHQISPKLKKVYNNPGVKDFLFWHLSKLVDTVAIKNFIWSKKKLPKHDLIYSAGFLCLRDEPWIVDMEFASTFTGYNLKKFIRRRNKIAKVLASDSCKAIIPWTHAAADSARKAFPEKNIQKKITVVPLIVTPKKKKRKNRKDGKTKFLFVGSSNLPKDFEIKGGTDVLEAFKRLRGSNDKVELTVRCYVPENVKKKYERTPGLKIIDTLISWDELVGLYTGSDVFVGVAHHTPGVAHLEAMSYGLPVIATDVWENSRIVNKKVGLLIPKHSKAKYFDTYGMPNWGFPDFLKALSELDEARIKSLVKSMKTLAEDHSLREKLSKSAITHVESGEYSVKNRNKILKKVFDQALK